jgi:dihydrofolate synthase / folylpolyglutamate synthase
LTTTALDFLFSLERLGMKFGLENISRLATALDHPERSFQPVIVAGTNGKGSVTAMVHRALLAAGHHAARYTSPHLERIEERYVVGDREVDPRELEGAAATVREAIEGLLASGRLGAPPTFFECATAMAFVLFRQAGVDVAVLEVGLGGRLDATNIVTPVAAAITSIDFDHQALLGNTLSSIAFEKAGVIKTGIPVICGDLPPEAERVIKDVCAERGARFIRAAESVRLPDILGSEDLSLRGAHQRGNATVAAALLGELDRMGIRCDADAVRAGLTRTIWPGRLETVRHDGAEILLDAAHNPAGAKALAAYLRESGWTGCALVFGAMQDKNVAAMLAELAPHCARVICTTADTPRAMPAAALAAAARQVPGATWEVSEVPLPADALAAACRVNATVVVAGSIFLIGPLRGILRGR